jgi:hypothetical protein
MGTQVMQNPFLARTTGTSLGLKDSDTFDIQRESPSRYTNERIQSCPRKTLNGQKSDLGLDSEGFHSKDTLKMDEPIASRTRRKFKSQYPPEAIKDKDILGRLQIEAKDKELLLQLIAQSKRQQGEVIEMNSVLKKVLELQISIVQELKEEITAELRNDTQGKSDKKFKCNVVKQFGPRAKLTVNEKANVCTMLPTTALDFSAVSSLNVSHNDVSLFYEEGGLDSPQN